MKTNFEQEFQDDFISVTVTSFNLIDKGSTIQMVKGPQAAAYSAIANATSANSTTSQNSTIYTTGIKATGNLLRQKQATVGIVVQANFAQNATVDKNTTSKVKNNIQTQLEKSTVIEKISGAGIHAVRSSPKI